MAVPASLAPTQTHVSVTVDYYDDEHKRLLSAYPRATKIATTVASGYDIPLSEFLTYILFLDKDVAVTGFSSYTELRRRIHKAAERLEGVVVFDGTSIHTLPARTNIPIEYRERIGEAVGLSVINELHGIDGADWDRIATAMNPATKRQHPIFDYQIASDGTNLIQVELKGTCQSGAKTKSNAVSNHKAEIKSKKAKIRLLETAGTYPYLSVLRYGTISVVDNAPSLVAHCWLLDPPSIEVRLDPLRLKLINRMRFLSRWISSVGPRTQLASALANRLYDLEQISDYAELNGVQLVTVRGEPFEFAALPNSKLSAWFSTRSKVLGEACGGVVVEFTPGRFFFVGVDQGLLDLALKQDHATISRYVFEPRSDECDVDCLVTEKGFRQMKFDPEVRQNARIEGGYVRFRMKGRIYWSKEGLAFGWIA